MAVKYQNSLSNIFQIRKFRQRQSFIFTLRKLLFYFIEPSKHINLSPIHSLMILTIFIMALLVLISNSHILMPPFLPLAYKSSYYEQKFRISQLNSAQFKISGLPKDIFWTSNGTIFGTPSIQGEWKLNISYESVTESGIYEITLIIKQENAIQKNININSTNNYQTQLIFPQKLIFQSGKSEDIEIKLKNGIEPISWKYLTLPKGVVNKNNGKLNINIEKQGMYILHIQARDSKNSQSQGCIILNIQNSLKNMSEVFVNNSIYQPNQNVNRLLEVSKKQTEVSKQIFEAAKIAGKDNQTLKQNLQLLNRISNSLIQLQNQAKSTSLKFQSALKEKTIQQQRLRQASTILKNAEQSLNLALIQRNSNNNLLVDSQKQKNKAQSTYDIAAKTLQNQLKTINDIQKRILQTKQRQENLTQLLSVKQITYNQLGQQILQKQKQIAEMNKQILKNQQQSLSMNLQVTLQQQVLNQQETKYSVIFNSMKKIDQTTKDIAKQVQKMRSQRESLSKQMLDLDQQIIQIKATSLFDIQSEIKDNDMLISHLMFNSNNQFSSVSYESSYLNNFFNKTSFEGCNSGLYPTVQGIFKVKNGSIVDQFYSTQNGFRILFGNCTRMPKLKLGDQIVFYGYTANGALHADTISPF